jgi:hypothetical protein
MFPVESIDWRISDVRGFAAAEESAVLFPIAAIAKVNDDSFPRTARAANPQM